MKKIIVLAVFACIAAMNVNAQTEGTESKTEKMLRLTKVADENPADWKAQLEAYRHYIKKAKKIFSEKKGIISHFICIFAVVTNFLRQ